MIKTLEVFHPPMCCSTGVCGPGVGPALAQQPQAFAANETVKAAIAIELAHRGHRADRAFASSAGCGRGVSGGSPARRHSANEVREQHARTIALIPWRIEAPVGPERLRQLACGVRVAGPAASQTEQ
jgi:hypothetical protein